MSALSIPSLPPAAAAEPVSLEERTLVRAFSLFTNAAASLERSYLQLQAEVVGLRRQLEQSNHDLTLSLEQNFRTRQWLDRILEGLPCGVVVREHSGQVSLANPEARRLLGWEGAELEGDGNLPPWARIVSAADAGQSAEPGADAYSALGTQTLALELARSGGVGIADLIVRNLMKQGGLTPSGSAAPGLKKSPQEADR